MPLLDRLALNILAMILLLCAGCTLSLIYWNLQETTPTYYEIHQEGNDVWITPITLK